MFKCRLDDDDELAAHTGVVETTREPIYYPHPANPNIRFWDLPGIGTPNYPDLETFCKKVDIEKLDSYLIFCAGRFTLYDLYFAEKVEMMKKSFFFVRTKIDVDVQSERRKKGFDEAKILAVIKQDCARNLNDFNFSAEKIFLISNHYPDKWDFNRLRKAILDELSSRQRESFSKSIMAEKVKILKGM